MLRFCMKINNIIKIITLIDKMINKVINIPKICFYCDTLLLIFFACGPSHNTKTDNLMNRNVLRTSFYTEN